jgi:hypothetical protein
MVGTNLIGTNSITMLALQIPLHVYTCMLGSKSSGGYEPNNVGYDPILAGNYKYMPYSMLMIHTIMVVLNPIIVG